MSSFTHFRPLAAGLLAAALVVTGLAATTPPAAAATGELGAVTGLDRNGDTYTFRSGEAALRVVMEDRDVIRVWLAPDGEFTDPANADPQDPDEPDADIVVQTDFPGGRSTLTETATTYRIKTRSAVLTVAKDPLTLTLADASGKVLWQEVAPLSWTDEGTTQHLARGPQEQYFGGGMQNGRFSHRDTTIQVSRDYNWNDGGNPNAAPFYLSSNGYGVLRNTFAPGTYAFSDPVTTTHQEDRFDAYFFVGDTREVIDSYTELTGRPLMVPMYALELGDADCYLHNANRGERHTLADSQAIAEGYAEAGMPAGWMLVNDGYGCGYEDLPETGAMLDDHGIELGLWTESDLTNQEDEVAAGVRVRKTDVAWVGPGYEFALSACEEARDGIESNSEDRAFVVTIEGWAGTQRCGATWSGDQSGSWDYIRWQIPTYAGSSLSGQHLATGDVDGIFGGSPDTYTRDLQWKMLLPNTYTMSGWADGDKQPWAFDETHSAINRDYLLLHERLLPYLYTHTVAATETGLGSTRPLYVNYPDDPRTWSGDAATYEFLAGDDFLVAPVYEDTDTRDGIYLPEGTWVDYWTQRTYTGPVTIDDYPAPLDRLPLFVRAGAIVPMFPEGTLDWAEGKADEQLDLDLYPQGSSEFTLYEDDGRTQAWADGESATQPITMTAPEAGAGTVTISIGKLKGSYEGKLDERSYRLTVHTDDAPSSVRVGGRWVGEVDSLSDLADGTGWHFDATTGVVTIQTDQISTSQRTIVKLQGASAVGGRHPGQRNVDLAITAPSIATPGEAVTVAVQVTNNTSATIRTADISVDAPEGWAASVGNSPRRIAPGESAHVELRLTPPADAGPGKPSFDVTYAYVTHGTTLRVTGTASTLLAYDELASAFDNVGVTVEADPDPGDIDGSGSSFIAERLAEAGVTAGAQLEANGFTFTWPSSEPGTPDNVASQSQTVSLSGEGNTLALLGTGTSGSAAGQATVHYTDGTQQDVSLGFPNWCCLPTDSYGAQIAFTTLGKNTPDGPAYPTTEYRLYTTTAEIDADREIAAVTLPGNSSVHVFAWTVGEQEHVPPPIDNGQYSLTNVGTGLAMEAPGSSSTQVGTGEPSTSPAQKWVLTGQAEGSYQVRNAGSGQCLDVFSSSEEPGAEVGQYGCGSTPNQRFRISITDGVLTLTAEHSGLVLAVDDGGLLVQVAGDGSDTQGWVAAAN